MDETKVICRHRFNTNQFHQDMSTGNLLLSAYASDLGCTAGMACFSQVWNDSIDEGFILVSHKTGKEQIFTLADTDDAGEGEIAGWRFAPYVRDYTAPLDLCNMRVLIIND